jgi:hypothetical protein
MTISLRSALLLALAIAVAPERLRANESALTVTISGPETLTRAAHTSIPVLITLPPDTTDLRELPLALTPHIDGTAIELVRGRLLRADAKVEATGQLRFLIPVVAHSEGTAILRVELMTYTCDPRCRRVDASGTRVLRVR